MTSVNSDEQDEEQASVMYVNIKICIYIFLERERYTKDIIIYISWPSCEPFCSILWKNPGVLLLWNLVKLPHFRFPWAPHPGGERRIFGLSWDTRFQDTDVSENSGTPKSSILIGFSIINHPFWGTTIFGNTHTSPKMNQWIPTIKGTISKKIQRFKNHEFSGAICYFFGGEVDISWVFLHEGSDQQKHLLYIGYF